MRWPILNDWVWPSPVWLGDHAAEVDRVRTWLLDRAAWMDDALLAPTRTLERPEAVALTVAPNPGRTFTFASDHARTGTLRVFDATGRTHAVQRIHQQLRWTWDAAELPSGTYFYEFTGNQQTTRGRLTKL